MSDHRDLEQDLVELALGEVAEPRRGELLSHLSGCVRCREVYKEVVGAIDATVPAAPEAQPPAGFDARVLAALGIQGDTGASSTSLGWLGRHGRPGGPTTARVLLTAAAAAVLVAAGGVVGATVLDDSPDQPTAVRPAPLAADTTVLRKSDGEQVGTAALAWMHERRVLVVSVHDAPVGVPYTCRVRLAEGKVRALGRWTASSERGGTWVMPAPQGQLTTLELVVDSGKVWSSARLP